MVLSHLLELEAFYILYYGQPTTNNGHYPQGTQAEHIYKNRYRTLIVNEYTNEYGKTI
jgi:hypothetical protein